jgi:hypothetical protein
MFRLALLCSLNDDNPRASNRGILLARHVTILSQSKNLKSCYYNNLTSVTEYRFGEEGAGGDRINHVADMCMNI